MWFFSLFSRKRKKMLVHGSVWCKWEHYQKLNLCKKRFPFTEIYPGLGASAGRWTHNLLSGGRCFLATASPATHGDPLSWLGEGMLCAWTTPPSPCHQTSLLCTSLHLFPFVSANGPGRKKASPVLHLARSWASPAIFLMQHQNSHLLEMALCHPWPRLCLNRAT